MSTVPQRIVCSTQQLIIDVWYELLRKLSCSRILDELRQCVGLLPPNFRVFCSFGLNAAHTVFPLPIGHSNSHSSACRPAQTPPHPACFAWSMKKRCADDLKASPFVPPSCGPSRRLVRPLLLSLLSSKLRAGGALHVATDVQAYAEHTVGVMETLETPENTLISSSSSSSWSPPPATEPVRGEGKEHRVESYDGGNFLRENHPTRETDDSGAPERSQRRQEQEEDKKIDHAGAGLASDVAFFPARWVGGEVQERPPWRPLTRYEEKAREAGRRVRDFSYRLESRTAPCQLTPVVSARE